MISVLLLLCLSAICNAELRTWTAVNGKEVEAEFVSNEKGVVKLKLKSGKVFEVPANKLSKEDNEFISSLAKPEGVNQDELERREGIMYLKGSDTPYTGKSFELYKDGQKQNESNYKDGKEEGLKIMWYPNGQKRAEGNFKDGWEDGLWLEWHENGQKKQETNWKDNKEEGPSTMWYKNGQKFREGNFKDGREDGLWLGWHPNGQKLAEADFKDGELIYEKFWNSKGESVNSFEETGLK